MILEEGPGEENGTFTPVDLVFGQNGDGRAGRPESLPARSRPGTGTRFPIGYSSMKRFVAATAFVASALVSPFFAAAQEPSVGSRTCGHRKTPTRTRCA